MKYLAGFFQSGLVVSGLLVSVFFSAAVYAETKPILRVAYIEDTLPGVDTRDTKVAIDVLLERMMAKKGLNYELELFFYPDIETAIQDSNTGKFDVMGITSVDYLRLRDHINVKPELVNKYDGNQFVEYVLLVRKDMHIKSLKQLENKMLILIKGASSTLSTIWLDTILLEHSMPESASFFNEVKKVDKISQAVLPVFFGQADACIVPRSSFDTMKELNPQVGKQLSILFTSPGLLVSVTCVRPGLDEATRKLIIDTTTDLEKETAGRQILTILQIEKVSRYRHEYMLSVEELYEKYKRLRGK